ncbi:unnamed protein product [Ceutorhynchus assimilis]|uniref:SAP domain-containing protein n=1 Tax=Ceutorhynchus assimilis TaxID=467358 RepID=A0A9N9MCE3_9CUCU|nr:unnamed protein product [Ceutorhynchus assimilis]
MATKRVVLSELRLADLKRELEEREMDTNGRKTELQQRLHAALIQEDEDPDIFMFEIPGSVDINSFMKQLQTNLTNKLEESSRNLQKKLEERLDESSRKIRDQLTGGIN